MLPVRAQIESIDSMSAHADSREILRWLGGFTRPPQMTYLVHGETRAIEALDGKIAEHLGWPATIPEHEQRVDLDEFLS